MHQTGDGEGKDELYRRTEGGSAESAFAQEPGVYLRGEQTDIKVDGAGHGLAGMFEILKKMYEIGCNYAGDQMLE